MLRYGLSVAAATAALDQASKAWIVYGVMNPPRVIEIAPFFNLVMVWNAGASFGLFGSAPAWGRYLLVAVASAICAGLAVWLARAGSKPLAAALGLVIGGAAGNVVDRLVHGAVADFLDFHAFGYHWPAFNAADAAISVGVAALVLDGLIGGRRDPKLRPADDRERHP